MPANGSAHTTPGPETLYDHTGQAEDRYEQDEYDQTAQAGGFIQKAGGAGSMAGPYVGVGPSGYVRSGDRTREDVCDRLTEHGHIDASNIEVTVENGDVILSGTVDSLYAKRLAEDTAYSVPSVREVHNRLRGTPSSQNEAADT